MDEGENKKTKIWVSIVTFKKKSNYRTSIKNITQRDIYLYTYILFFAKNNEYIHIHIKQ